MKRWTAFWAIIVKDMRTYYLKPPNLSWGIIFPLAWTGMFFIRSGSGLDRILDLLPGVMTIAYTIRHDIHVIRGHHFREKEQLVRQTAAGSDFTGTADAGENVRCYIFWHR